MKKYNKPEIVALALETVDVIETSGGDYGERIAAEAFTGYSVQAIADDINNMDQKWSW